MTISEASVVFEEAQGTNWQVENHVDENADDSFSGQGEAGGLPWVCGNNGFLTLNSTSHRLNHTIPEGSRELLASYLRAALLPQNLTWQRATPEYSPLQVAGLMRRRGAELGSPVFT